MSPQIIIYLKNGLSRLAELFPIGCNCFLIIILSFYSLTFSLIQSFLYRLRLLGRTPPILEQQVEEKNAEELKGAEKEVHDAEKEEPKSAESDRSSKGVYYNGIFLSDIN